MNYHTPEGTPDHPDHTPDRDETWESEMTSAFDRRVRDLHEAPLTLDLVKGRAVRIRRKRRAAVAGGVLAAAAVVTPVAFLAADGLGSETSPVGPAATPSPTAVDSSPPLPEPAASVAYLQGTDYHRADGSVVTLPKKYEDAVTFGGRVVAARNDEGTWTIDVVEDGDVVDSYDSLSSFVVSGTDDLAAFLTTDGDLQTVWADGEKTVADGFEPLSTRATAVVGGPGCEADDCRVYVEDTGPGDANVVVDGDGGTTPQTGIIGVDDVSPDGALVVAQTESNDFGACSAVLDPAGAEVLATCDNVLEQVSDDGRHVIGLDPQVDGAGPMYYVVLDLEGNEVARFDNGTAPISRVSWLDDETVAMTAYARGGWRVLTQDITTGEVTDVAGPVPGDPFSPSPLSLTY